MATPAGLGDDLICQGAHPPDPAVTVTGPAAGGRLSTLRTGGTAGRRRINAHQRPPRQVARRQIVTRRGHEPESRCAFQAQRKAGAEVPGQPGALVTPG